MGTNLLRVRIPSNTARKDSRLSKDKKILFTGRHPKIPTGSGGRASQGKSRGFWSASRRSRMGIRKTKPTLNLPPFQASTPSP